jgi:chromosome partitioning protein
MNSYENLGLTQRIMAKLAEASPSAVSRCLSNHGITPMDEGNIRNMRYSITDVRTAIGDLLGSKEPIRFKKHIFYNFKGGTGKTSMCFQVSAHLALMGYNVLVIDADPQAHLSLSLGITDDNELTLYDIIVNNRRPEDAIKHIYPGLDCIPSNITLTRLEVELSQTTRREERFNLDLSDLAEKYDFVFIDTNPTISLLNRNAINYADIINVVCETQPYSLNGLKLLMEDLNKFFYNMGISAKKINIIPNKYEDRTANSAEAMTVLKKYYTPFLKEDFAIRRSEDMINSAKLSKPLAFFAKKNSIALEDIVELAHYIKNIAL